MVALAAISELAVGQSLQLTTSEGRWVSATGVDASFGGGSVPIFTAAPFTQPASITGTVNVSFNTTVGMSPGDFLFIRNGGYYAIAAVLGPTSATLTNLDLQTSVAPLTAVAGGQPVTLTGPPVDPNWYDVRLFGAVPTDVGIGVAAASVAVAANKGGKIYVPQLLNGQAWTWTTPVAADFTGCADVELAGSSTWIQVRVGSGNIMFQAASAGNNMHVDGFVFTGDQTTSTTLDCIAVLYINSNTTSLIENCSFWGLLTNRAFGFGAGLLIVHDFQTTRLKNLQFYGCAVDASTTGGTILLDGPGTSTATLDSIHVSDIGNFGGQGYTKGPSASQVFVSTVGSMTVRGGFFDENAVRNFWLNGISATLGHVVIEACTINVAHNLPHASCVVVEGLGTDSVRVDSCFLQLGQPAVTFDLIACRVFQLYNTPAAPSSNNIAVRSTGITTSYLELKDSPGYTITTTGAGFAWPLEQFTIDTQPQPTQVGPRFVDPANSTGFAADTNTGRTANNVPAGSGPLLTTAFLAQLLYNRKLSANSSIKYMSDDTSGTRLDRSQFDANGFVLTFSGTPQTLHTGGTIDPATHQIDPSTNQRESIKTSDIVDWTPFIFLTGGTAAHPTYVKDTTGGNAGTISWVDNLNGDLTLATGTRPVTQAGTAGTIASGDSYVIQRGSLLSLDSNIPDQGAAIATLSVVFQDFAFDANTVGNPVGYVRCSFEGIIVDVNSDYDNCFAANGIQSEGFLTFESGLINTTFDDFCLQLSVSGDTLVTGFGLVIGSNAYEDIGIRPGIGAGLQVQDTTSTLGGIVATKGVNLGSGKVFGGGVPDALVWGTGQAGAGVAIAGGTVQVAATAAVRAKVTGAGGDFRFIAPNGVALDNHGWTFDEAVTGTYVSRIVTNWGNLFNAASFNFAASYPLTGSVIAAF